MFKIVRRFTKKEMIKQIKNYYSENPDMTMESFNNDKKTYSVNAIIKKFGTWENALEKSRIYKKAKKRIPRETIIEHLKEHYSKNSYITSVSFQEDRTVCSTAPVIREFGTWNNALIAASIYRERNLTKKEIISQLKRHYSKRSAKTFKSFDEDKTVCSYRTVFRTFGSWKNALIEAGIKKEKKSD